MQFKECDGRSVIKCFHPNTCISTQSDKRALMKDLKEGDQVLAFDLLHNKQSLSKVKELKVLEGATKFLDITTKSGRHIFVTNDHCLFDSQKRMIASQNLRAGDSILSIDDFEIIEDIFSCEAEGAIALSTQATTVVVNNVVCSCFIQHN